MFTAAWLWLWPLTLGSIPMLTGECLVRARLLGEAAASPDQQPSFHSPHGHCLAPSPPPEPSRHGRHGSLSRFPPRKASPCLPSAELPSAAAPSPARCTATSCSGWSARGLGAQRATDAISRKLRLVFLLSLPLPDILSASAKGRFPASSENRSKQTHPATASESSLPCTHRR